MNACYNAAKLLMLKIFFILSFQISKSNASQVVLTDVGFSIAGNMSCEVTTEGPGFRIANAVKELIVVGKF